jgi:hypothetical protein
LRGGQFGKLLGRWEALDRWRQHGVRIGIAMGRAAKLRQRQRGAQFEAARLLRLSDRDRGLQGLLGPGGVGRVPLQQDLAPHTVHLRFVPAVPSCLQLSKRTVQAPALGIGLAGIRFRVGQGRFETGPEPNQTVLSVNGEALPHLRESRIFGCIGPL